MILRTFLRGLLAFLPVFLTIYAVYHIGSWLNRVTNSVLTWALPGAPTLPGLGIIVGAVVIFALGMLVSSRITRWIYQLVESPLRHLPIIKELYIALKQLTDFLSPNQKGRAGQVVSVRHPDHDLMMVGLLMREHTGNIGLPDNDNERVAVYLPMSYQVGGFTMFVPRSWVNELDIPVETALRETLTGWMEKEST